MTKPLFDTIRDIKGKPLTQGDVDRVNAALGQTEAGPGAAHYERLLRVVASPQAHAATLTAMAEMCARHFPDYRMTTRERQAEFIAQIANETGGFVKFEENLNYSARRMTKVWPGRYPTIAAAAPYANNPQALANHSYANRMGNGPPASGDGWRYRGRGALQLTGRAAYRAAGVRLGLPLEQEPDRAADPAVSVLIALDFWRENAVNAAIDAGGFTKARRITNGGAIGLEEVRRLRAKLLRAMG